MKVNREFLGKKEKFAALGISLDGLLEYTEDDTREPTFEVSMFGELFQDMLDTRFGRGLLRSFAVLEKQVYRLAPVLLSTVSPLLWWSGSFAGSRGVPMP